MDTLDGDFPFGRPGILDFERRVKNERVFPVDNRFVRDVGFSLVLGTRDGLRFRPIEFVATHATDSCWNLLISVGVLPVVPDGPVNVVP